MEESHTKGEGQPDNSSRIERSDTETEAAGGEAGPSQSLYKKRHMILTDSDKEAIVAFVKEQETLYDKTSGHFKDKARKEYIWEQFAKSRKLSIKMCKTRFDLQKTC